MILDKTLPYIASDGGFDFYLFKPSFGKWLYHNYEKMRPQRWVRFFLEYIAPKKYAVCYMAKNDTIVGYCVVAPGGRRLKCSTPKDIVLGPYFVLPEFRGLGYSKALVKAVISAYCFPCRYVYDYIRESNVPSIRATEYCGFKEVSRLNIKGLFRHLVEDDKGEFIVYRR